jgi:predicted transposase/invertase (TIGR01784 family)
MPHNPHDAIINYAFSKPDTAAGELRSVLPPALVDALDFDTLKLEPGSFVDEALAGHHTDLLYAVELEGREAFIYVLFEHQSTVDPLMPFRMLRYTCRVWERWVAAHPNAKRLPAVVPVVLYHGRRRWTAARRLREIIDLPAGLASALADHIPELELVLDDLHAVDDEALRSRAMTVFAKLVLFSLRYARTPRVQRTVIRRWAPLFRELAAAPSGREALGAIIRYLWEVREKPDFIDALLAEDVGELTKEIHVSYADKVREEAREKGHIEGRETGRTEGRRALLLRLLASKFGPVSRDTDQRIAAATAADLDRWAERLLTAERLDEVWE